MPPGDVLSHLQQTIAWYRHVVSYEQDSGALPGGMRGPAAKALQLAFDFGRAEAALQDLAKTDAKSTDQSAAARLQRIASRASDRVARAQKAIDDLDASAARAKPRDRAGIAARRKQLVAGLELAKQAQKGVQSLSSFAADAEAAKGGLLAQVNQLARTVPDVDRGAQNQAAAAPAQPERAEPRGLLGLMGELFGLIRSRAQLRQLDGETERLLGEIERIRTPLASEMRDSFRRADALAGAPAAQDPEALASGQREMEALTARFKHISAVTIPLREQAMMVQATRANLKDWGESLSRRYGTVGGALLARAAGLAIAIFLVLGISSMWRRMTFRYVRDERRRRQFLLARRFAVVGAIAIIVLLAFITELGSLATYAGFLTAGLAVALQNVILSVVGYFFLIGRHGLRPGDRVTIGGVTGDVLDIGLVRIYLMEVSNAGGDMQPTGRVVVFSNSVLFQPSALFKQLPGTEYVWRTAKLVLTRESNAELAERTLTAAADSVYQDYRARIESQHQAFERSVDIKVSAPHPETRLRFTDGGLEFTVRYPAELRGAGAIDGRMVRALYDAVSKEPDLKLAPAGEPKLV